MFQLSSLCHLYCWMSPPLTGDQTLKEIKLIQVEDCWFLIVNLLLVIVVSVFQDALVGLLQPTSSKIQQVQVSFRPKNKCLFSYSAVSSPLDRSKCFTLHPLSDLFIPAPT